MLFFKEIKTLFIFLIMDETTGFEEVFADSTLL